MTVANWNTGTKGQTLSFLRCRICGYEQVSVHPTSLRPFDLECSNCGNMTADAVDIEE